MEQHAGRIDEAKRLIVLFAWRKKTRREVDGVSIVKLFQHIEPFIHAIDKRRAFESGLQRFDALQARNSLSLWRAAVAQKKMEKFQKALLYSRWKASFKRLHAAGKINTSYLAHKYLRKWREAIGERHVYKEMMERLLCMKGIDPRTFNGEFPAKMLQRASELSLKAGVFHHMRSIARVHHYTKAKESDRKFAFFKYWSKRVDTSQWSSTAAVFHDKVRLLRPILALMQQKTCRFNSALDYLASNSRLTRCHEVLGRWKQAVKTRATKRRFFDTFTRKARFLITASEHARRLSRVTSQLRSLQVWKCKSAKRSKISEGLAQRESLLCNKKTKLLFATWRAKAVHQSSNACMVEAWRNQEEKRECFKAWKNRAIIEHNCKTFYLRGVFRLNLSAWRARLTERKEERNLLSRVFGSWRRHAKEMRVVKYFAGSQLGRYMSQPTKLVPSNILVRIKCIETVGQAAQLGLMARFFSQWHASVSSVSALEKRLQVFTGQQKRKTLHLMRLVLRTHEQAEKQPRLDLERAWRRLKAGSKRSVAKRSLLAARLDEHVGSQAFLGHFRHFKVWERAFQVRKMEEHLCEQNLLSYQHRQKLAMLKSWKLLTAQHMFQQYSSLLNTRKAVLARWRKTARGIGMCRSKRVALRAFSTWRDALLNRRAGLMQSKRKALVFRRWRLFGERKYEVRFARSSAEKIDTPWFLQTPPPDKQKSPPPPPPRFDDPSVRKATTIRS